MQEKSMHESNKAVIGRRHKEAREDVLKMSVADYAVAVGVKEATVYSWESGRTAVPHHVLAWLEREHGVSTGWLLAVLQMDSPLVLAPAWKRNSKNRTNSTNTNMLGTNMLTGYHTKIPMLSLGVSAGLPVASDDTIEREIDLAEMLLEHPESTYFIRVVGDSMTDAGIGDGDTLIVDCAVPARPGQVVIAKVYGELTVKRYLNTNDTPLLRAENRRYKDIAITPDMDFAIVGVVRSCIKQF